MKLLLTGKDGQVGFELRRALVNLGEVVAVDRVQCDLANPRAIRARGREIQPNIIVNPAACTTVDQPEGEPKLASAVNAAASGLIGEEAGKVDALVVHYAAQGLNHLMQHIL